VTLNDITGVKLDLLVRNIALEFPAFKIVNKSSSAFMKLINFVLLCVSFGQLKGFMTTFTTTIGYTVYVPTDWDTRPEASRAVTLRHERVHMRQCSERGQLAFSFLYLFIFPIVRAIYRTKFEQEAYAESFRAIYEYYGPEPLQSAQNREHYISHFTGSSYLWMWTKRADIERWYDDTVARILSGR